jgi:hypothetical protein
LGYLNVFEVRWLCFVRKQKGGQNYSNRIIVWNQDDKIIRGRNNRGTRKTLVLLWENHFTRYYLRESIGDWLYGENSDWFWAVGNLSQCLKKDICNFREIRENAALLSVSPAKPQQFISDIYRRRHSYIPIAQTIYGFIAGNRGGEGYLVAACEINSTALWFLLPKEVQGIL